MQLDLELYREEVQVAEDVTLSLIEVSPERPDNTLVFIHGFGGNARQWQYQIEAFAERNRVLAPDLRGHGRSDRPRRGYDMAHLVGDLEAIVQARDVHGPLVLVGHSFGGAIATEFALAHPRRVSRLVLIASADEYDLVWPYKLMARLPPPVLASFQPLFKGFVDASLLSLQRMFHSTVDNWQGTDKFPRLDMPVLIIRGERDRVFPQAAFARVASLIPDADDVNVGASAHMVMIERRDAVNRTIDRFVEAGVDEAAHSRWRSERTHHGRAHLLVERPWLLHYESGVPHTLDIPRLPLTRLLDRAAHRFRFRPAILYQGRSLNYRTLSREVARCTNALRALGVVKGTRVMLLLPNVPNLVIAYYGALRLGAIVVMSNPLADPEEIARQARESGAEILVTLTRHQDVALAVGARSNVRHVVYAHIADYYPVFTRLFWKSGLFPWRRRWRRKNRLRHTLSPQNYHWRPLLRQHDVEVPHVEVQPEDVAVIQYTGGTTAHPHGVTLTHYNLVANTFQTRVWIPTAQDGEERILSVLPFSHIYGMTTALNLSVALGAAMILLPEFDTREVLESIKRFSPSLFPGVPSMYVAINDFPNVRKYDVQSIQACLSGAAPLPIEVKEAFEKLTRGRLVEGYGLTEAGPVTHANPIFGQDKVGSIGLPLPNTEAKIVDLRTGIPLPVPAGQFGELMVRGPQVMGGYWHDPAATKRVLDADGWLRTGDVARMDEDGYFQIISRRQDMWQGDDATPAFPRDAEEVIYELPEVREVVVVGIANRPVAFVQLKEGTSVPARSIIAYAHRRLPPDQVPRHIVFVKDFPRTFIGKVLRRELVSQYAREIEATAGTVGEHLPGLDGD